MLGTLLFLPLLLQDPAVRQSLTELERDKVITQLIERVQQLEAEVKQLKAQRPVPAPPEPAPAAEQTHTVAVGDSFWSIAEHQVTIRLGRTPTDADVLEPWLALIDANRDRLLDPDDPDLLHPGQILRLPDP